jgi:hypothetical protein
MSNPTKYSCKLCNKETAQADLVPMKSTNFLIDGKRINVLDTYRTLLKSKKLFSAIDARICRECLSKIIQIYMKKLKKTPVCANCDQPSKILYSKNAIFMVEGRSIALSEVFEIDDDDTLCFSCCSRPLGEYVSFLNTQVASQPEESSVPRLIIIRKVEDSAPSTSSDLGVINKVISLNICLNCFKPSTEENIVDMRCMRVTVNEQQVEFMDCFQFCTKRAVDTSSATKPLVCFKCMTAIVKEYEEQYQPPEVKPEIKIEPVDPFESAEHGKFA